MARDGFPGDQRSRAGQDLVGDGRQELEDGPRLRQGLLSENGTLSVPFRSLPGWSGSGKTFAIAIACSDFVRLQRVMFTAS